MLLRQQTPADLRQPIQEILDDVDEYIMVCEIKGVNHEPGQSEPSGM